MSKKPITNGTVIKKFQDSDSNIHIPYAEKGDLYVPMVITDAHTQKHSAIYLVIPHNVLLEAIAYNSDKHTIHYLHEKDCPPHNGEYKIYYLLDDDTILRTKEDEYFNGAWLNVQDRAEVIGWSYL